MKRLTAVVLLLIFVLSAAVSAEYADCSLDHKHRTLKGYSTGADYQAEQGFGSSVAYEAKKLNPGQSIEIDGFKDDIWNDAYVIEDFVVVGGAENNRKTKIKASYMWDAEALYVWAEVYDDTYCLSWDNGKDWAAWGDYIELFVDTLHNSSLSKKGWEGNDGPDYRGKNPNSGSWPDGSEYEDCCFGQFKISAGFNQTVSRSDPEGKIYNGEKRGGAVQWQEWTWLSAACQEDDFSNFTSAFIYEGRDLSEPYKRYTTKGGIQNGDEKKYGKITGYTFEAQITFHSAQYMPEDGSVIGAGLRVVDTKDLSWWGDTGEGTCIYAQEKQAGDMWAHPKNLPNLVLLPAEDGETVVDDTDYTIRFTIEGKDYYTTNAKRGETVTAPEDPAIDGYDFLGWSGYSDSFKVRSDKTFEAILQKRMDNLPETPSDYQTPGEYTRKDKSAVSVYKAERTSVVPVTDGIMDDIYKTAKPIPVKTVVEGKPAAAGFAYILWDDEYIYAFVTVNDEKLTKNRSAGSPWLNDSVEFVIDTWNKAEKLEQNYGDSYRPGDYVGEGQFRINAGDGTLTGTHWLFDNSDVKKEGASRTIDGKGYTAEYKIAWGTFASENNKSGKQIGFAILINDGEGESRRGIAGVDEYMLHSFEWAGALGKLTLSDESTADDEAKLTEADDISFEPVQTEPETQTDAATESDTGNSNEEKKNNSNLTGLWIAIGGVAATAAIVGAALVIKKKKKQ